MSSFQEFRSKTIPILDGLLKTMGATYREHIAVSGTNALSEKDLEMLADTGIEVAREMITDCPNGTFEYMGVKVLVYIRDWRIDPEADKVDPYKFHIMNCNAIKRTDDRSRRKTQPSRYVVSTRSDGVFNVNKFDQFTRELLEKDAKVEMRACRTCLSELNYRGYQREGSPGRTSIFEKFSVKEFFRLYPPTFTNATKPVYDDRSAPITTKPYTEDWGEISRIVRERADWRCSRCARSYSTNRADLHVHHINGDRTNNSYSNLKALCKYCHQREEGHSRMSTL